MTRTIAAALAAGTVAYAVPAHAQDIGAPFPVAEGVTLDPILAARVRYETVEQGTFAAAAHAVTARARIGAELKAGGFSLLAEGEGTTALSDRYNDTLPGNGIEPYPSVSDPENLELNRLQIAYMRSGTGVTVGRQRIVHDDGRFVGNGAFRQNEQTFDAVRGQAKAGPLSLDAGYAISQRTVFGYNSPNKAYDGDLVLLNAGLDLPAIDAKAFAYLIDYEARPAFSNQTYGAMASAELALPGVELTALARAALQSDYGANPVSYQAPYFSGQLGVNLLGFALTGGYEELGSDGGVAAFQTPLAALHAFNGWADMFLTTPATGLRDYYLGASRAIGVPFLPGLKADLVFHQFESDVGGVDYGHEWDASLGFRLGPVNLLAKYANYQAHSFATDTEKLWLQGEIAF